MNATFLHRYWSKVSIPFDGDVFSYWPWTGAVQTEHRGGGRRQDGRIRSGGRGTPILYAHRVALILHTGHDEPDKEVDHLCGNSLCCNPDHLVWIEPQAHRRQGKRRWNGPVKRT